MWFKASILAITSIIHVVINHVDGESTLLRHRRDGAFDLLRIETALEHDYEDESQSRSNPRSLRNQMLRRDDALNDEKCQKRCNDKLRSGLDMVKAHSSFGSIGVPSVIDQMDLQMFCRLDSEHDKCLKECGYEIQFNMRDYVCRDQFPEMVSNLRCYERSASKLKRHCGAQHCGPYSELELSLAGFGQRCRTLLCDLGCTQSVLINQCGRVSGLKAAQFLIEYTRIQVSAWMKDLSKTQRKPIAQIIPASCSRIFCDNFNTRNCTTTINLQPSRGRVR